jgi:hypothetical protein
MGKLEQLFGKQLQNLALASGRGQQAEGVVEVVTASNH